MQETRQHVVGGRERTLPSTTVRIVTRHEEPAKSKVLPFRVSPSPAIREPDGVGLAGLPLVEAALPPDEPGRTTLNQPNRRRSPRPILSWLFLALSVGLFAAGAFLYFQEREADDEVEIPIAAPGKNELIHVVSALEAEGLAVEPLTGAEGVRSRILEQAGQPLTVDGVRLYVFIYQPDAAAQEEATLDVLPEDIDLENNAGDPVAAADLQLFTGSNVAAVLVDGDDRLAEKISAALGRLP